LVVNRWGRIGGRDEPENSRDAQVVVARKILAAEDTEEPERDSRVDWSGLGKARGSTKREQQESKRALDNC
jgi:hypothetical protein